MEFGVYQGETINLIASLVEGVVYGFDSFEGLPEGWFHGRPAGHFSTQGRLPEVRANVTLIKGWFEDTLPPFLHENICPAKFIHIDSDIYSSAKTVLSNLRPRIIKGTVIVFDEFLIYPGWQQQEFKAFHEFIDQTGMSYKYLGFTPRHYSVATQIE